MINMKVTQTQITKIAHKLQARMPQNYPILRVFRNSAMILSNLMMFFCAKTADRCNNFFAMFNQRKSEFSVKHMQQKTLEAISA